VPYSGAFESDQISMIYFIENTRTRAIKIGYTKRNPEGRLRALQTGSCDPLKILSVCPGHITDETYLHLKFQHAWIHGEWFSPVDELRALIIESSSPGFKIGTPMPAFVASKPKRRWNDHRPDGYLTPEQREELARKTGRSIWCVRAWERGCSLQKGIVPQLDEAAQALGLPLPPDQLREDHLTNRQATKPSQVLA
jgi:Meiotically Up-regulated Gene 113 (MUG113) protein